MLGQLSFEKNLEVDNVFVWLPSKRRYLTNAVTSRWYQRGQGLAASHVKLDLTSSLTSSVPLALLNLDEEGKPM